MKENWKSTLIGFIIIISGLVSVFLDKSNWTEASVIIATGAGFIFTADAKKK
jgi:hypothetical protein